MWSREARWLMHCCGLDAKHTPLRMASRARWKTPWEMAWFWICWRRWMATVMVSSTSRHKVAKLQSMQRHTIDKSINPPHLCHLCPYLVILVYFFIQSIHILLVILSCSIYVNHFESVDLFASDPGIFSSKSQNQMPLLAVLCEDLLPQEFLQMMRGGKVPTGGNALWVWDQSFVS